MVSAIQTVPSTYIISQIVRPAVVSQLANQTNSQLILSNAMVNLGATKFTPVTYNAFGTLGASHPSVTQSTPTKASVNTIDSSNSDPGTQLTVALEASSIAENSAVLDEALADSLAKQLHINASAMATGVATAPVAISPTDANLAGTANTIESSEQFEIATQTIATNTAKTLDKLLSASVNLSSTEPVPTAGIDTFAMTDRAATLPLATPLPQSISNEISTAVATTPATSTNVVAASNTTTMNSLGRASEVDNSLVGNRAIDSGAQAVTTVAKNPAYANLVAGNYVSMAAISAHSPLVIATPMRLEEVKPVIAIPAITSIAQIGAQSGRDGNPSSGYRQRAANSSAMRSRP